MLLPSSNERQEFRLCGSWPAVRGLLWADPQHTWFFQCASADSASNHVSECSEAEPVEVLMLPNVHLICSCCPEVHAGYSTLSDQRGLMTRRKWSVLVDAVSGQLHKHSLFNERPRLDRRSTSLARDSGRDALVVSEKCQIDNRLSLITKVALPASIASRIAGTWLAVSTTRLFPESQRQRVPAVVAAMLVEEQAGYLSTKWSFVHYGQRRELLTRKKRNA